MNTIILKPKKEESVKRFHPWVFSGAIAKIVLDKHYPLDAPREGEVVRVESGTGARGKHCRADTGGWRG